MNISMWAKAIRTIPNVTKKEWDGLDIISRWLIASRAGVLVITFISVGIAGLLAARDGAFDWGRWLLLALGLLLAHATNNLVNDFTDYIKGVDRNNYVRAQYGPHPLEHGLLTKRQVLAYIAVTGLLALGIGIYLVTLGGTTALWLLGLGVFFVLFYTWPLKYIGMGEIAVLIVWGPLMIGGGYFVVTGNWDWNVVWAGMPYAIGATTIIFGKHIDKVEADRAKRIFTLPVILGERLARYSVTAMMVLQYAFVVYLVVIQFFTPVMLIVLLALPRLLTAAKVLAKPHPTERPTDYPATGWPLWFVGFAFVHNRRFGSLFLLGLIVDVILRGFGIL
jgi:1,4-dihydroxy-2-naphthoate octaprenyltransferase